MDYKSAKKIKDNNEHLIGKKDKGAFIDEIIIVPTNDELANEFLEHYLQTLNGEESIIPFTTTDVDVFVVFDKSRIAEQSFLVHTNILNLSDDLGVVI